jgi:hypothetical protein
MMKKCGTKLSIYPHLLMGNANNNKLLATEAKLFASAYAIFSGLLFITVVGILLTPFVHRILHRFHFMKTGPEPSNSAAATELVRYRERITSQFSGVTDSDLPNPGIQIGAVLPVWTSESPTPISWRSSHAQRGEY